MSIISITHGPAFSTNELAQLLGARKVGADKYRAPCPVHGSRSLTLSIGEGENGVPVIHCHAGCPPESVLAAVGLTFKNLYSSTSLTPEERSKIARERQQRATQQAQQRQRERKIVRLEWLLRSLGFRLAREPEGEAGDRLAQVFHRTLDRIRELESAQTARERVGETRSLRTSTPHGK